MKKLITLLLAISLLSACGAKSDPNDPTPIASGDGGPAPIAAEDGGSGEIDQRLPEHEVVSKPEGSAAAQTEPVNSEKPAPVDTEPAEENIIAPDSAPELYTPTDGTPEGLSLKITASPTYATYYIINGTDSEITMGDIDDYRLEVYAPEVDGGWADVSSPDNRAVSPVLLTVPAGQVFKATVGWEDIYGRLGEGRYRLAKTVNDGENPVCLYAEFAIFDGSVINARPVNVFDGVSVSVSDVSKTGLSYSLKNGGDVTLYVGTGYDFTVQAYGGNGWEDLALISDNWSITEEVYSIGPGESFDATVDWSGFYGELPAGKYRFAKSFSVETSENLSSYYCCAVEFEIK